MSTNVSFFLSLQHLFTHSKTSHNFVLLNETNYRNILSELIDNSYFQTKF